MTRWKEIETNSAFNTGIAAEAVEQVISGTKRVDAFNRLLVQNRGDVDIQVQLDGMSTGGRIFEVTANNGILQIEPEDGVWFVTITQKNLSTTSAETADTVLFRVAKCVNLDGELIKD